MDKLKMAHDWAIKNGSDLIYKTVEEAWSYADAMQAEEGKRSKVERPEVLFDVERPHGF